MRIYYEIDEFTSDCKNKCPFIDPACKDVLECSYVGSVACQECKFCYGSNKGQLSLVPKEEFVLQNTPYIKCLKCYKKTPFMIKLQHMLYQIKLIFKK